MPLVRKYIEEDPVAAAHTLETLQEEEAVDVLKALSGEEAGELIRYFNDPYAARLLQMLPYPLFKSIVEELHSEKAAAIFFQFPDHVRQLFLHQLGEKEKRSIQDILTFPEDSAGRIMSRDFLVFHSDLKIRDAVKKIRLLAQKGSPASYAYVVDRDQKLVGVMNMRDVIIASPEDTLGNVMRTGVFSVNCFMDREVVASELSKRHFFAAPVVDAENRLMGVVKAESLIDDVQKEATEDVQKMFGAGGDERAFSPIGFSLRKRLPWLHVNLATAFLAASVVALFEDVIGRITVLAVFLPVVAGQGGNAGAQSLAVVMRGLVMREIPRHRVGGLIAKEATIGLVNGLVIGVVTAAIAWFWQGNPYLGVVIGLGMLVNLLIAGLAGAGIPLVMKGVGLDPAQCSNIILTTITDVMGFLAFLGFAVLFESYLV